MIEYKYSPAKKALIITKTYDSQEMKDKEGPDATITGTKSMLISGTSRSTPRIACLIIQVYRTC